MPVITITTDWGTKDYFVGAMKGDILSVCPEATLVDITHSIKPFDLVEGAFVFKNSWARFPKGTVHLIGMSGANKKMPVLVAISHKGHFFIGPDDGFFALVFEEVPSEIYFILDAKGNKVFSGTAVLASSGSFLAKGGKIKEMGSKSDSLVQKSMFKPVVEENTIKGYIIYIDTFGNLITNIDQQLFERVAKNRDFEMTLRTSEYTISKISDNFMTDSSGELLVHYNESGLLEIAISQGDASKLIGLKYNDIIRIEFK